MPAKDRRRSEPRHWPAGRDGRDEQDPGQEEESGLGVAEAVDQGADRVRRDETAEVARQDGKDGRVATDAVSATIGADLDHHRGIPALDRCRHWTLLCRGLDLECLSRLNVLGV